MELTINPAAAPNCGIVSARGAALRAGHREFAGRRDFGHPGNFRSGRHPPADG